MRWPRSRRKNRNATSSRRSNSRHRQEHQGRPPGGPIVRAARYGVSPDASPMTTLSAIVLCAVGERSGRAGRDRAARGRRTRSALASRISVPGESSGSHRTVVLRRLVSPGRGQKRNPQRRARSERAASGSTRARDLAKRAGVVAAVVGVSAQEFDGEAGAVEAVQLFDRLRRAPDTDMGMVASSRLVPLYKGKRPRSGKRRSATRP